MTNCNIIAAMSLVGRVVLLKNTFWFTDRGSSVVLLIN